MKKRKAVIVFVKYPEKGKVKTRLASTTNDNFAVGIYNLLAGNIFNQVGLLKKEIDVFVFYAPFDDTVKIKEWVGQDFFFRVQRGNNLGEKMANAFEEVFAKEYSSVIIIGSDVPEISREILMESFKQLITSDIVIAPSDDGGYSLLGMKKFNKLLFQNIDWSTSAVLEQTKNVIKQNNLNLNLMAPLNDIDTFDELEEWTKVSGNKNLIKEVKIIAERENISL